MNKPLIKIELFYDNEKIAIYREQIPGIQFLDELNIVRKDNQIFETLKDSCNDLSKRLDRYLE